MNAPLWFSNLVFWSAQVALIVLTAWLLVRILRIREPRVLIVHWRALIVACLSLPIVEPWHRLQAIVLVSFGPAASFQNLAPASAPPSPHWNLFSLPIFAQMIGALILLGIAFRLAIFALGLVKLRHLRRASSPIPPHTDSAIIMDQSSAIVGTRAQFRLSTHVESPVTFGLAAPVILLPERFLHLDAQFQSAIACHELLHARRRDWAHHLAEEFLRALFWFHPAILWLIARVRLAREQLVDLEVVRLTCARKTYLEALLEFTASSSLIAAIPAPPFLAERQVVERVALMLKEVRMSRIRLIASLSVTASVIALAALFAVSVFPLKAAPRPQTPITQSQTAEPAAASPVVAADTIWTDKVKHGDMPIQVRGLAKPLPSANQVRVSLPEEMMRDVRVGQTALVDTHHEMLKGHVSSLSSDVNAGMRTADITLDSPLPNGTDSSATFNAMIQVGQLENVVYIGRPAQLAAGSQGPIVAPIFKIIENGQAAQRLTIHFGRASATTIQVLSGLEPGDTVILSDMSPYDKFNRVQIKR